MLMCVVAVGTSAILSRLHKSDTQVADNTWPLDLHDTELGKIRVDLMDFQKSLQKREASTSFVDSPNVREIFHRVCIAGKRRHKRHEDRNWEICVFLSVSGVHSRHIRHSTSRMTRRINE